MSNTTRDMFDKYYFPLFTPPAFIPVKGKGCRLWDENGNEYIDFGAGIAVTSLGHCNDIAVKALKEQSEKLWHVSNLMTNEPVIALAKRLVENTFADKAFFCNSGAEANEGAFKLARRYALEKFGPEKDEIISFNSSFHGRTLFTVSVGGQSHYSEGFGPNPGSITHIDYNDIEALRKAISKKTCAVVLEPVQGEGGIIPAAPGYLEAVRKLCDENDALLVYDEVQTGCGRSGKLFAYMQSGVAPDILTTSKGLGTGFPIGALLATDKVASVFTPGVHGTTFGGNALACAVADKVIATISDPEFLKGVDERSRWFFDALNELKNETGVFKEIRGMGLLIGAVLDDKFKGKAKDILKLCADKRLLVLVAGGSVVRIAPALNISREEFEAGMLLFKEAVQEFAKSQNC